MNSRLLLRDIPRIIRNYRLISTERCSVLPILANLPKLHTERHHPPKFCQLHTTSNPNFAKSKDKGKKNNKDAKVEINTNEISSVIDLGKYKQNLQECLNRLKDDFLKHVSLRSSAGAIEGVKVTFESKRYEVQELAQVVRKNPKTTILNMETYPQAIPAVLQALAGSGLNLNPQQDGTTIFIPVPKITKEHRENLAKNAKALFIKCRDGLNNSEVEFVRKVKNQDKLSKDLSFSIVKQLNAVANTYRTEAKNMFDTKCKELLD